MYTKMTAVKKGIFHKGSQRKELQDGQINCGIRNEDEGKWNWDKNWMSVCVWVCGSAFCGFDAVQKLDVDGDERNFWGFEVLWRWKIFGNFLS